MQSAGLDTSSTEARSVEIHLISTYVLIYWAHKIRTIVSNVFILKGYLFMSLYNPYRIRKTQGLWVCIILIILGKPKVCVNLFEIEEPIKLLFKGGGKEKPNPREFHKVFFLKP